MSVAPVSVGAPIWSTGMVYGRGRPANGVLTANNTISGQSDHPLLLVNGSNDNILRVNDFSGITAQKMDVFSANQITVRAGCNRNLFAGDPIDPLGDGVAAGISNTVVGH